MYQDEDEGPPARITNHDENGQHRKRGSTLNVMLTLFGSVPGPYRESQIKQQIEALAKPRPITISWRGRLSLLFVFLFIVVWMALFTRGILESSHHGQKTGPILAVAFLFLFLSMIALELRREIRCGKLLREGELAIARVTSQRDVGGRTRKSEITYEFIDLLGRMMSGKGIDLAKRYEVNMPLIVFYEAQNSANNVGICNTIWSLRLPDGSLVSPS